MKNEPYSITQNPYQRINWLIKQAKKFEKRAKNNFEHAQHELRKAAVISEEQGLTEWYKKRLREEQ